MNIQKYDIVVLTEDFSAIHKQNKKPILLKSGQVGTVLIEFNQTAYLIDFADHQGNTYAMETVRADKLIVLNYESIEIYV
jgi:hypothetical protein